MKNKSQLYSGIIWIISAIALAIYGFLIFFEAKVWKIEDLINFLSSIDKNYIYLSAFISVFIEGLYIIGNFFPGASLVMISAIISGASGYIILFKTLILIFIGWNIAGIINIYIANIYRNKIIKLKHSEEYSVKDNILTTWFPSFRSSYEVAQIIEGGHIMKVYISSIKVRFLATLFVGMLALIIPLILDINQGSFDRESIFSIFIVFCINLIVGIKKIKKYLN
jgi:hypothetical protein